MNTKLNQLNRSICLVCNREWLTLIFAFAIFCLFPRLARQLDVTAAPIDVGALSAVIMAILAFLVFKAVTWGIIRLIWPVFASYSENQFNEEFLSLSELQKVLIYLGFYLLLLMGFVGTLAAVL
ncbi:hypothetical protein [Arcticibacter sp. MXS-1]|uniref:hypothetical protein n=1 Tax=Arcticibacter sp. MXS-1 TaxID=3341726 RepID=UPI0035A862AA